MTNFRTASIASLMVMATTPSWADPWRLQKYPDDGFQVEWSGQVTISPMEVPADKKMLFVHATQYSEETADSSYYGVGVYQYVTGANLDGGAKGAMDGMKCKSVVDHPLDIPGIRATEQVSTDCSGYRVRARFFATGNLFYGVLAVVGPAGDLDEAQHFVESFKLIDK
jgi:hypothetical protein